MTTGKEPQSIRLPQEATRKMLALEKFHGSQAIPPQTMQDYSICFRNKLVWRSVIQRIKRN